MNYYNECDPVAAATLRQLIAGGHIAFGIVDERSIEDVRPSELAGFTQCHFFAGIGVWSYALRLAGWSDHRPVWTGSCPCQPFSAAGQGAGFDDERHLWPAFEWLIRHAKPRAVPVFGEQVASKDGLAWLDLVQADMEGQGHAVGAVDTCAAGFGAPHIRQRLYWVAHAHGQQHQGPAERAEPGRWALPGDGGRLGGVEHARHHDDAGQGQAASAGQSQAHGSADQPGGPGLPPCGLGHTVSARVCGEPRSGHSTQTGLGDRQHEHDPIPSSANGGLADAHIHRQSQRGISIRPGGQEPATTFEPGHGADGGPGPVNGYWAAADWLLCRDGKWRPVEPGTFPLVNGSPARVGRLRGYGNAINAQQAQAFIESYIDAAVITPLHCTP